MSRDRRANNQSPVAVNSRRGPLRVSFRAAPGEARVHLAVPKSVGTAVVRNRVRRRIRETLRELTRDEAVVLAGGEYYLGVYTSLERVSAVELRSMVSELLKDFPGPAGGRAKLLHTGGAVARAARERSEQEREAPRPDATGLQLPEHVLGR